MTQLFYNGAKFYELINDGSTSTVARLTKEGLDLEPLLKVPDELDTTQFANSGCLFGNSTPSEEYYRTMALKLAPHVKWKAKNNAAFKRSLMTAGSTDQRALYEMLGGSYRLKVDQNNKGLVNALQHLQLMCLGRLLSGYNVGITADRNKAILSLLVGGKGVYLVGKGFIHQDDLPSSALELPATETVGRKTFVPEEKTYTYLTAHQFNRQALRTHSFNPLSLFNRFYLEDGKHVQQKEAVEMHVPFLGVELETVPIFEQNSPITRHGQVLDVMRRMPEFMIAKSDGSLRNNGAELVTCPAVFEQHMQRWENFFGQTSVVAQAANCAGLHVHVNRTSVSAFTLGKIVKLMEGRQKKSVEADVLYAISGRTPNQYCEEIGVSGRALEHRENIMKNGYTNRYSVINFNNASTVEFRFMKGTTSKGDLKAKIQMVQAMLDYAQSHSPNAMVPDRFLTWLDDKPRAEKFPELNGLVKALTDDKPESILPYLE